jgi:hypothetical protein
MRSIVLAAVLVTAIPYGCLADTVTFEDVGLALSSESFYNGGPTTGAETISSGGVGFSNYYDDSFGAYWSGFAYSNVYDITTSGSSNQYAAYTATGSAGKAGAGGSKTYAVAYDVYPSGFGVGELDDPTISFSSASTVSSIAITNTTYAYKAIVDGDDGGVGFVTGPFADDDTFILTISGSLGGSSTGTVDVTLAKGTSAVISDWTTVDLSSLGTVDKLTFELESTKDLSAFGWSTPNYFAADDLTFAAVPEPGGFELALVLLLGWLVRRWLV